MNSGNPTTGLVLDPRFERHDTGGGHPDRPARLARVRERLESSGLAARCRRVEPRAADDALLRLAHDARYIERVERACRAGDPIIDTPDVPLCAESAAVAREAAGSLVALCDEVAAGRLRRGLAAVRPPGHHAERDVAMGFCLFNTVAIAARSLRARPGIDRVLIVDWDVHHGNGTQHILEDDPSIFFFSLHQSPLYPGTGGRHERGVGAGTGATLNRPLPPGAGDVEFLGALRDDLVPAADAFRPDFVLVSAGFDAHIDDPLANLEVTTGAFAEATAIVLELAARHCDGRLVSTLEGGYDLDALAESVDAHLRTLVERGD